MKMRQKIEKMSHKNEKSDQDPPKIYKTWAAMERKAQQKLAKANNSKQKQGKTQRVAQNSTESPRILKNPSQNPPKIPPKPIEIQPKSSPEASKSPFEDHSKYKHAKMTPKNCLRGPQSFQTPPKTLPRLFPKRAPDPSKSLF